MAVDEGSTAVELCRQGWLARDMNVATLVA